MISSPVPTVNRSPGTKGFENRVRFTFLGRAWMMSSRHSLLPDRNRSRTEKSTCAAGLIWAGAEARLLLGDASANLRINHRPNHPGVISSTGESGLSLTAAEIGSI